MSSRAAVVVLAIVLALLALHTRRAVQARSLIPVALDAVVEQRHVGREKHPGRDDRYFLVLLAVSSRQRAEIEVIESVFNQISVGDRVEKARGERVLRAGERRIPLAPGPTERGLTMALALAAGLPLLRIAWRALA